ncbi:unnamed protein product, partial [Musa textilis]
MKTRPQAQDQLLSSLAHSASPKATESCSHWNIPCCYSSKMPQAIDGWSIIAVSLGHASLLVTTLILINEFVNLTDKVIYHYICSHFPMILSCSIISFPFHHSRSVLSNSQ